MTDPFFFGFGSLVNTATHSYQRTRPARLEGWQRLWVETQEREIAFLSAAPCPGAAIDGLLAAVPDGDWVALDEREFAYERIDVTGSILHDMAPAPKIAVYSVPGSTQIRRPAPAPILLSYLDVVIQGYAQIFGTEGAEAFFATTVGWDRPVLNDRATPRYPRHQSLSPDEQSLVDRLLLQKTRNR